MNKSLAFAGALLLLAAAFASGAELGRDKACYASSCWTGSCATGAPYTCNNVTDSFNTTYWYSANGEAYPNVTIDLNSTYVYNITNVDFLFINLAVNKPPNIYVYSSDDNFTTQTLRGSIAGNAADYRVVNFTSGVSARYWRVVLEGSADAAEAAYWIGIYGSILSTTWGGITIYSPENYSTTSSNNVTALFNAASTSGGANCTRYSDGVIFNSTNVTNSTNASDYITMLTAGIHSYNVTCVNTTSTPSTPSVWFTNTSVFYTAYASLNNCSDGNSTPVMTFFMRDESNETPLWNGTVEIDPVIYWYSSNGSLIDLGNFPFTLNFSLLGPPTVGSGTNNASICMSPNYSTVLFTDFIVYSAPGYSPRSYTYWGNLSNVTSNFYLYLLPATAVDQVIIYVVDENSLVVPNVWVQAQRYYVGNASYKTVAQVKMDDDGKGTTYLKVEDTYYRFVITSNGTTLAILAPTVIICPSGSICPPYSITLRMSQMSLPYWLEQFGDVSAGCVYNNATFILTCYAVDASGETIYGRLLVEHAEPLNYSNFCDSSCASSSCGLTCNVSTLTNGTFRYFFSGYSNSPSDALLFSSGTIEFGSALFNWGANGLMLAFLLVLTLFAVGLWNPVVSIAFGLVGIVISSVLGLMYVSESALVGIIIVGAMLAWKLKT